MDIQVREQIINHLLQVCDQKQRVIEEMQKRITSLTADKKPSENVGEL